MVVQDNMHTYKEASRNTSDKLNINYKIILISREYKHEDLLKRYYINISQLYFLFSIRCLVFVLAY
jgi:hypothetical protein